MAGFLLKHYQMGRHTMTKQKTEGTYAQKQGEQNRLEHRLIALTTIHHVKKKMVNEKWILADSIHVDPTHNTDVYNVFPPAFRSYRSYMNFYITSYTGI